MIEMNLFAQSSMKNIDSLGEENHLDSIWRKLDIWNKWVAFITVEQVKDIDSYGEISQVGTVKSCSWLEWDRQVEEIIKGMPRWTPAVSYSGKGSYQNAIWTVPVIFKGNCL